MEGHSSGLPRLTRSHSDVTANEGGAMEGETRNGSMAMATKVLAAVIAVAAITIAATTGDSWAVRAILVLVAGDVAVRLWRA